MKKKTTVGLLCLIMAMSITAGCANSTNTNKTDTNKPTEAVSEITTTENNTTVNNEPTAEISTEYITEITTNPPTDNVTEVPTDDIYEFVDESVTNPTVAPADKPTDNTLTITPANITPEELVGTWLPLTAVDVADGKELHLEQLFGSSYRQYGGSLTIKENGNFTIGMGAAIIDGKSSGTFTLSDFNLLVTYKNQSVDTYLYIPSFQGKEVIKVQINNAYVYFYRS